jgi:hypothetical protein
MFWVGLVMLSSIGVITILKGKPQPIAPTRVASESQLQAAREEAFKRAMKAREQRQAIEEAVHRARKPEPLLHVTAENFEDYCKEWCWHLGYLDAKRTRFAKDGGIDIHSSEMVAQVKFQELPVGVKPIRELFGVASAEAKTALFFSLNGYSREAAAEAKRFNMQLWIVRPFEGKIYRANEAGNQMNQGDYHSGPEGYSPNSSYSDSFYGSTSEDHRD